MIKISSFLPVSLIISPFLLLNNYAFSLKAGNYIIDQKDSKIEFQVKNFGFINVTGKFNIFKGTVKISENFLNSKIEGTVETNSIDTDNDSRDKHLKSEDFFEVEKYPNMKFVSKNITGDQKNFKIIGDLTIKGIAKSVTFTGVNNANKDNFQISCVINRKDFNIKHSSFISDEVQISMNVVPQLKDKK